MNVILSGLPDHLFMVCMMTQVRTERHVKGSHFLISQHAASRGTITLVGVLSACAAVGALELGTELDSYASQRGFYSNVYVGTALVDMYSKGGDLTRAFGKLPCKNEASWNALICGLAFNE